MGEDKASRGSTVLSVRFSQDEIESLKQDASRAGLPVSSLVRNRAVSSTSGSFEWALAPSNLSASTLDGREVQLVWQG